MVSLGSLEQMKIPMRGRNLVALALAALLAAIPAEAGKAQDIPQGSGFDFYVLALSWSPSYCLQEGPDANRQQCASERDYRFVVHGLWPQFENGYPEYCSSREPERVPSSLAESLLDIVPSVGLVGHIWRKHGTCSGLGQKDFLRVLRAAREQIIIPERFRTMQRRRRIDALGIEDAFVAANEGMTRAGIAAVCSRGRLREVRICLTDDLAFRSCRKVDLAGCRATSLNVPPPE